MTTISERPTALELGRGYRLGPIVLATDGSADAEVAQRAAGDIAMGAEAAIHVVGAWSLPILTVPYGGYVAPTDAEHYETVDRTLVGEAAARLERSGVPLAVRHPVAGRPADAVLELADEVQAGLIVMGSRGLGPVRRLALGSVSDEVVHRSHRPVLVTRGGSHAWPLQRVVVGDDGSVGAAAAVGVAAAVGRALRVRVVVITVITHLPEAAVEAPGMSIDRVLTSARAAAEDRVAGLSRHAGVRLGVEIGIGDPAATLLDEAADRAPCLLVVGSRGLGAIARMRHGSVSRKVLHAAETPVLVVPGPSTARQNGSSS